MFVYWSLHTNSVYKSLLTFLLLLDMTADKISIQFSFVCASNTNKFIVFFSLRTRETDSSFIKLQFDVPVVIYNKYFRFFKPKKNCIYYTRWGGPIRKDMMASINDLPDELLEFIFGYMPPYKDLESCALVCKRWTNIVRSKWFGEFFSLCYHTNPQIDAILCKM